MSFVQRWWNWGVNETTRAMACVVGAVGRKSFARRMRAWRTLRIIYVNEQALGIAAYRNQNRLRDACMELDYVKNSMRSAMFDVRRFAESRVAERDSASERAGVKLVYARNDVLLWMTDLEEISRFNDLRTHKMQVKRLTKRVDMLNRMLRGTQRKQEELNNMIADYEMSQDFEHIARSLDDVNLMSLDPLTNEILKSIQFIDVAMSESVERTNHTVDVEGAMEALTKINIEEDDEEIFDMLFPDQLPAGNYVDAPDRSLPIGHHNSAQLLQGRIPVVSPHPFSA